MIFEFENYRIAPYSGKTCWKIQERGDADAKGEWREPHYFPVSFRDAVKKVRELVYLSGDKNKVMTLDQALKRVDELNKQLDETLNNLEYDKADDAW